MEKHQNLKSSFLSVVFVYACFTLSAFAEENTTAEKPMPVLTEQTELVESDLESGQESETAEKSIAKDLTEEDNVTQSTPVNKPISESPPLATPQPPLIDPQLQPSYGPKAHDDTPVTETTEPSTHTTETQVQPGVEPEITDKDTIEKNEQTIKQPVTATPQPPRIDSQPQPGYEPKSLDDSPASETAEPALQIQVVDEHIQPADESGPEMDNAAPITADPVDTESEQLMEKTETTEVKPDQKQKTTKWTETYPVSVNADWLQLKSGEWLRGRITVMQNDSLEFDSDELKDLVIKWKNVKYLKSYEPYSLRFDSLGRVSITGIIEVRGDKVNVKTDYDEKTYDRSDLLTIASGKETEISLWKSKVTFSINVRKGNTDQTDFTSKMTAKRRTTDSRLILDYLGNFTQVQETETINNHRLNETYDIFLSRNLFWTPIFSEFFRDPFQNIEQRIKIGIGIGYTIINTNESEWNITGGPAYQETSFDSVQSGADPVDSTLTLVLGTKFDTELNSIVDLEGLYSVSLGDEETGNYTHHAVFTIETELTDELDFDVSAVWDHVRSPVADENNITPYQDDFRIMVGLGYDF